MSAQSKVAVLLAAYNGMNWIEEQIDTILNQKDVEVTLFISVDISSDGTEIFIQQLSERDNRVILLPYGEKFGAAAPNFFRLIRDVDFKGFDLIAFADQDDIWYEDKLSRAAKKILQEDYGGYSSDVVAFWADGKEVLVKKSYPQKRFDYFFESAGPGCTCVFSNDVMSSFQKFVIQFQEEMRAIDYHDWLAYVYCRENSFKWFIDDKPSMKYRQHANNQIGSNTGWNAIVRRLSLIRQKWYRKQISKIIRLVAPQKWENLNSRWFLIRNFSQLRRNPKEAIALLIFLISFLY